MPLAPRISAKSITALQKVITGNETTQDGVPVAPYCSGPVLVSFFNQFGYKDSYGQGFPSRWDYVETKLAELNGTESLAAVVEEALSPARFLDSEFEVDAAAEYVGRFLAFDGLALRQSKKGYRLVASGEAEVDTPLDLSDVDHLTREFINDQLQKCDEKIAGDDFDGAITNARSLVEAILRSLEERLTGTSSPYGGKLPKLYKRVQSALNLDPDKRDLADSLQQVLRGLSGIVYGLSGMRNQLGDAHARRYRPRRHHATLAVNASKTLAAFLLETYEYQLAQGLISPVSSKGDLGG